MKWLIALAMTLSAAVALSAAATVVASPALAAPATASSAPAWSRLADPFSTGVTLRSVATFGSSGVALLGSSGSIAISQDGGATWRLHKTPAGNALQAIAFANAKDGFAVGPAGTILESTDGGATWHADASTTLGTFSSVAASSGLVTALGPTSITATTTPGAPSWTVEQSPTAGLAAIVCDAAGFGAAAGSGGAILTRDASTSPATWTSPASLPAENIVALALAPAPVWGDGTPDLFAVSPADVQGSDDQAASFDALPTPPAVAHGSNQLSAAYMGGPHPTLLVGAQAGLLERYDLDSGTWRAARGRLTGDILACAAGPGSVAYALSKAGLERTLAYGGRAATLTATPATVTGASNATLTVSSPIRASGRLILEQRPPGGAWQQLSAQAWSAGSPTFPAVSSAPQHTTQYRLRFVYAGATAVATPTVTVRVQPVVAVDQASLQLKKGDTFRLTGHVSPAMSGASVTIWTNRGGPWHQCRIGGTASLTNGSTFQTRLFGTPLRQTYLMQVRVTATRLHLAAVSARVQVTIK